VSAGFDFGSLASSYDRLRPADDAWHELLAVLVEEGDLTGRRLLDVGCGTGRVTLALAELGCRAWGIDPSADMLREARTRAGRRAAFKEGRAESLPFCDGWFERAVLRLVVHLLDLDRALPELARVVCPGGRAVIATFRPEHFEELWLTPYFPSIRSFDMARFPDPSGLAERLAEAGFPSVRRRDLSQRRTVAREEALERIRGCFISTLSLVPEAEFAEGLVRAERELPAEVDVRLEWAVLVAQR
jgi:SAM-dependent methyltransferase